MDTSLRWIPEIVYEEADDGLTSNIPFISVPPGQTMPKILFIFESSETGEFEPGPEGEDLPVTEMELHQYCDMGTLKEKLNFIEYDNIRFTLGLEPLANAAQKGKKITDNVRRTMAKEDE